MCLVWRDGTFYINTESARLSRYFFHINTQLEGNTSPYEVPLFKLHIFSVVIVI